MEQRLSLITLGVADLDRARKFYEDVVGWTAAPGPAEIVFFDLDGVIFSLFPHDDLAEDMAALPDANARETQARAETLRRLDESTFEVDKEEVDEIFARLEQRGAAIVKMPQAASWGGYSGYFSDPDGHKWEIAYNPYWTILDDGRISLTTN